MIPRPERPPEPPIALSKVLVAEGMDCVYFIEAFLKDLHLSEGIEVRDFGAREDLHSALPALVRMSGFEKVESLGIVLDAETQGVDATFESVLGSLNRSGLPRPDAPATRSEGSPTVSVFILPDCTRKGMLETLCRQAAAADRLGHCVDEYLQCVEQVRDRPRNMDKAWVHTFLSAQGEPGLLLGQAASRGYFPRNSPVFNDLRRFLQDI
jgi:hypothetical protein